MLLQAKVSGTATCMASNLTRPYFVKSNLAINQDVYLGILKSHLTPFIKRYYSTGGYVFWPDLASSHYASRVQDYFKSEKIVFVPKDMNPANVPKARPIEDFWGTLKQKVYKGNWSAKNIKSLKLRIAKCLKQMDLKLVQKHIETVKSRLDTIRRHGV